MEFAGEYFIYNGIDSRKYGLRFLNINTDRIKALARTMKYKNIFHYPSKNRYETATDWDDELSVDVEILRQQPISQNDRREISNWLFNTPEAHKLYISNDIYFERINGKFVKTYILCTFSEPEIIEFAGGVRGWKAKMNFSSVMGEQDEVEYKYQLAVPTGSTITDASITIKCDTDLNDYIYPTIKVVAESEFNSVNITNNTTHETMSLIAADMIVVPDDELYRSILVANINSGTVKYYVLVNGIYYRLEVNEISGVSQLVYHLDKSLYIMIVDIRDYIGSVYMLTDKSLGAQTFIFDCANGTVLSNLTDDNGNQIDYYDYIVNNKFLRLVPGENDIHINGTCNEIDFIYNNKRWLR